MGTSITKSSSRKTKRVSIAVTGVAACTAFAGPSAMAATVQVGQPILKAVPRIPDIKERGCGAGTSNWFHLAFNKSQDICFGFTGTTNYDYFATSFCGGNNTGYISGSSAYGKREKIHFGHGTTYAHITGVSPNKPLFVSHEHISGYAGNDKCKFP